MFQLSQLLEPTAGGKGSSLLSRSFASITGRTPLHGRQPVGDELASTSDTVRAVDRLVHAMLQIKKEVFSPVLPGEQSRWLITFKPAFQRSHLR